MPGRAERVAHVVQAVEAGHQVVRTAADAEGRLPLSRMTGWEVFPFEQAGLRVVPLGRPVLPEPDRVGETARDCPACTAGRPPVWSDEHWRLSVYGPSGAPLILMLEPRAHHDLPDLPDDRAGEMGLLIARISRAIESLPHIARAHVSRWGDGAAHLHIFFFARPAGFAQLRGTCLAIWDDLLPAVPAHQRDHDAAAIGHELAGSYGGRTHPVPQSRQTPAPQSAGSSDSSRRSLRPTGPGHGST